ncbi:MAG TPA: NAD(P)-dependent oxidoreductase [Candidatus Limnocylindrales bacterium]|nr:NAD(P)-dependent oxidoreductase [Candidatus Limnocylindrales bacterium]
MRVAFLGLGIMGRPMAANLVNAGHEVTVWNRTPKDVPGATTAASPAEAVKGKEAVWVCVSDTKAVQEVLFGAQGAIHGLESGTVVVDSSTISPSASLQFMEDLQERGCDFLDAPVTGSKVAAESGSLTFMIGGNPHNIEKVEPLLRAMGKKVIHMGDNGKGLSAKLAQNMNIVFMYEGLCESLTLAKKLGVAPEKMFELIESSMIRSGVAEYKKPFILAQDYSPNFPLKLMHKDIHLMLDAAKENDVKLPGLTEIDKVIYEDAAARAGFNDLDYAATIMLLEEWAGLRSKAKA